MTLAEVRPFFQIADVAMRAQFLAPRQICNSPSFDLKTIRRADYGQTHKHTDKQAQPEEKTGVRVFVAGPE